MTLSIGSDAEGPSKWNAKWAGVSKLVSWWYMSARGSTYILTEWIKNKNSRGKLFNAFLVLSKFGMVVRRSFKLIIRSASFLVSDVFRPRSGRKRHRSADVTTVKKIRWQCCPLPNQEGPSQSLSIKGSRTIWIERWVRVNVKQQTEEIMMM